MLAQAKNAAPDLSSATSLPNPSDLLKRVQGKENTFDALARQADKLGSQVAVSTRSGPFPSTITSSALFWCSCLGSWSNIADFCMALLSKDGLTFTKLGHARMLWLQAAHM